LVRYVDLITTRPRFVVVLAPRPDVLAHVSALTLRPGLPATRSGGVPSEVTMLHTVWLGAVGCCTSFRDFPPLRDALVTRRGRAAVATGPLPQRERRR
jgi:hypothetical protein